MSVIEVAIGPGPGGYRVDVLYSTAGEASAVAELDVESLLTQRGDLQRAVLVSSVPTRKVLPEEQRVRDVGQALFGALLGTGEVAGRYRAAAAVAAERGEGLRVVLRIEDPALAGLPWEAMYDQAVGTYVCRRDQLVRHVGVPSAAAPLAVNTPLRVLGIVSSPRGLFPLDVEKEKEQLTRALTRLIVGGSVELVWAPSAVWADLQDLLLSDQWHVVHFIGHGDFDPGCDEGVLALTGEDGRKDLVEASRLVDLLRQARPVPRLVVLNSCSGAATGVTDLFSGTAAALVRGGVTAVAAMQYEISDPAAIAFARGFYLGISNGRGVDEAVSSGRTMIVGTSGRTLEWVTPVLYLRGHDSHLFTLPAPREAADNDIRSEDADFRRDTTRPSRQATGGIFERMQGFLERGALSAIGGVRERAHIPERVVRTITADTKSVNDVAFSVDGRLLASAGADGTVRLWETATGREVCVLSGHNAGVNATVFSPDGALLASAAHDKTVRLWDIAGGSELRILACGDHLPRDVAFSPDGTLLASAGADHTVQLWQRVSGAHVRTFAAHTAQVRGVAFSPDGTLLASAGEDMKVRLWELASDAWLGSYRCNAHIVRDVAFNPDGTLLAFAGADRIVRLQKIARFRDTERGWGARSARTLVGHTDQVNGVAFSPDGTLLASAGADGTVRLWQTGSGRQVRILTADPAVSVAFSPDGSLLASASSDGSVRLWG